MNAQILQVIGLAVHAAVVIALVIAGAVTHDHSLIDAGLAYGAGTGSASATLAVANKQPPSDPPAT